MSQILPGPNEVEQKELKEGGQGPLVAAAPSLPRLIPFFFFLKGLLAFTGGSLFRQHFPPFLPPSDRKKPMASSEGWLAWSTCSAARR